MVVSHTGVKVAASSIKAVVTWYEKALAPLGYKKSMEFVNGLVNGYGDDVRIDWWVSAAEENQTPVPSHHAFSAKSTPSPRL
jgi:hypothetical protein